MSHLEQIIQQMMSGAGRPGEWLWSIDERSLLQHLAKPRQHFGHFIPPTASMLTERIGSTAVISIAGVMVKEAQYEDETSTPVIAEAVAQAAGDPTVDSILLSIDSPGGSVAGLDELAQTIVAAKALKPVVAQSNGLISSAAYYVASQADKIFAKRMDMIGSIGTRMMLYDFSQMLANFGVRPVPIDTGAYKSLGAFGTEITEDQTSYLQGIVDSHQKEFAEVVQRGRGFSAKSFAAVADGRLFLGEQALALGLIDAIQKPQETLAAMPRRQSPPQYAQRSKSMSETNEAPKAATLQELKAELPEASNDFLVAQQLAGATLPLAMKAYNSHLAAELRAANDAKVEADARAAAAEAKAAKPNTATAKIRGNLPTASSGGDEVVEPVNYRQLAQQLAKERGCTFREACQIVKRRHPEAREAFKGDPLSA